VVMAVDAQAAATGPAPGVYYVQSAATGLNAAQTGDTVAEHRPKGNEDHQQWSVRADGSGYRLENPDAAGRCLGRSGAVAAMVDCASGAALWQVTPVSPAVYALKDPGAASYLTV